MRMPVQGMRTAERVRVRAGKTPSGFSVGESYTSARGGAEENTVMGTQSVGFITSNDDNPWGDSRGMRLLQRRGGAMGVHDSS